MTSKVPDLYSSANVAEWCGVTGAAVSNWMRRYPDDYPREDARMIAGKRIVRVWKKSRKGEWLRFAAERHHSKPASGIPLAGFTDCELRQFHDYVSGRLAVTSHPESWRDARNAIVTELDSRENDHDA